MKLSVTDRVLLLGILPREGNVIDMNTAQNVRNATQFSIEELDGLEMVQMNPGMQWNAEVANEIGEKEVVVGVSGAELVKKTLVKLSDEEKLPMDALPLYRKFVDADLVVRDDTGKIVRNKAPEIINLESSDEAGTVEQKIQEKLKELDEADDTWSDQPERDKILDASDVAGNRSDMEE